MMRATGPRPSMDSGYFCTFFFSFVALLPSQAYSQLRLERFILFKLKPQRTFVILTWCDVTKRKCGNPFWEGTCSTSFLTCVDCREKFLEVYSPLYLINGILREHAYHVCVSNIVSYVHGYETRQNSKGFTKEQTVMLNSCLLYTSPSPRDA